MPDISQGSPDGFMYDWDDVSDKWCDRIQKALFEYAIGIRPSQVLAMIDTSFWENGKKGCIFTCDGFVSSDMGDFGIDFIEYSEIKELSNVNPDKSKDNDRGLRIVTKGNIVYERGFVSYNPTPFMNLLYGMSKLYGNHPKVSREILENEKDYSVIFNDKKEVLSVEHYLDEYLGLSNYALKEIANSRDNSACERVAARKLLKEQGISWTE